MIRFTRATADSTIFVKFSFVRYSFRRYAHAFKVAANNLVDTNLRTLRTVLAPFCRKRSANFISFVGSCAVEYMANKLLYMIMINYNF